MHNKDKAVKEIREWLKARPLGDETAAEVERIAECAAQTLDELLNTVDALRAQLEPYAEELPAWAALEREGDDLGMLLAASELTELTEPEE